MLKPEPLTKGDTIAIIAPSGGLAALVPHRLKNGIKALERLGYKVKVFPTAERIVDGRGGTIKQRIKDIHSAFENKKIKAIITTIGGLSANELLPHIDYQLIKKNPKIFCGYSDITLLHGALHSQANLITFYGPALLTQFGEYPEPLQYTVEHFQRAASTRIGEVRPSENWTDELLDWFEKKDLTRPRKCKQNEGYQWIKKGKAKGKIVGGCLSSLLQLRVTDYDFDYSGKILFIETPEGQDFTKGEPLDCVDAQLCDMRNAGIFDEIAGLVIGRGFGYSDEERKEFKKIIKKHTTNLEIPVLFNVDIGHSDPMITIPIGVEVELDGEKGTLTFLESGVSQPLKSDLLKFFLRR